MSTKKNDAKRKLQESLAPLLDHLSTAKVSADLLKDKPLTITVSVRHAGERTQGTLRYGVDKHGVCGFYLPKDRVGPCPDQS